MAGVETLIQNWYLVEAMASACFRPFSPCILTSAAESLLSMTFGLLAMFLELSLFAFRLNWTALMLNRS